jgi:hypothetical protein
MIGMVKMLMMLEIMRHPISKLAADESSLGNMIASSYFKHNIPVKMVTTAKNMEKTPNASGLNKRVRMGDASAISNWAVAVPDINLIMPPIRLLSLSIFTSFIDPRFAIRKQIKNLTFSIQDPFITAITPSCWDKVSSG